MKAAILVLGLAVLAMILIAGLMLFRSAPDPSQVAYLKDPRIVHKPDERMLVVEATGDPNVVGGQAFKTLSAGAMAPTGRCAEGGMGRPLRATGPGHRDSTAIRAIRVADHVCDMDIRRCG
jgi:hypothetical protein